jgi:putative transposase
MFSKRNITSTWYIESGLYSYFLGLSTRGVSKALFFLNKVKRSHHVIIWKWIQKYPKKILSKRKRISEFIVDETLVKVGSEYIWIWVVTEPEKQANSSLFIKISKERNMFVAERFIRGLVDIYGKHPVSTDGGT